MVRINTTIKLYKESITYEGHTVNDLMGEYEGWIEEGSNLVFVRGEGGQIGVTEMGKGTLFLWEDIDLTSCFFLVDEKRCDIVQHYKYVDGKNRFHHLEVIYK